MGRAPKFCANSSCPNKVVGRSYCDDHAPQAWSGGYGSTRTWRKLRAQVLTEEPICACGAPATDAGHIVPRSQGGPDTRSNLVGQCEPCNLAQMRADRKAPRRTP